MTKEKLKKGDSVTWNSPQGKVRGNVIQKVTTKTKIKTHTVAARKDNPEYIVQSKKTGKKAAYSPKSLKKT